MKDKLYYIKGSKENPDSIERALLDVYPNARNNHDFGYCAGGYYYAINDRIGYADTDSHIYLLKRFGEEIQPKKQEKFVKKTMYKAVVKGSNDTPFQTGYVFVNKKDALETPGAIGYQEIEVMIKE